MMYRVHREREEQMRVLTSQLLLLEANLRAKQSKIDALLNRRDRVIANQNETIRNLERQLERCRCSVDAGSIGQPDQAATLLPSRVAVRILGHEQGDESLDDSDSAVVIEDHRHSHSPTFTQSNSQVSALRSSRSKFPLVIANHLMPGYYIELKVKDFVAEAVERNDPAPVAA